VATHRASLSTLRRNRGVVAGLLVFGLIALACLAAPLYAEHVAGVGPEANNITGTFQRNGRTLDVVTPGGRPVGPGWSRRYLLGADRNGRDVMVRMLYGGRNSLVVGIVAALITTLLAVTLGLLAGYLRGWVDAVIRGGFDLLWSFPVVLLAIALGTALAIGGLELGPVTIEGDSLWIPILVLGAVYVPYLGRPIRGQVIALRESGWVEAAEAQGLGAPRIMVAEILPNLASTLLVFGTLIVANNILTEAGLSFLGAGIQGPSWGSIIAEGVDRPTTAPHLAIVPGLAIVATVLALNVVGDGLRAALDPRARVSLR